jgi:hypothetical protein
MSLEGAIGQAMDCLGSIEQPEWPRYVMSSDFQNFLVLDLETSEKVAFPLAELPQRLEMFDWIAGNQRRSFAEEDEVNFHAAELMGRFGDLGVRLTAPGKVALASRPCQNSDTCDEVSSVMVVAHEGGHECSQQSSQRWRGSGGWPLSSFG